MTAPALIERQGWRQWSLVKAVDVPAIREGAFDRFGDALGTDARLVTDGFNQARGIGSCDYQVRSESEFTLDLRRTYKLFPLDYLSLSGKRGGEITPLAE